jgi:hypothetical protein
LAGVTVHLAHGQQFKGNTRGLDHSGLLAIGQD